jgi:hypothetical protein
LLSLPSDKSTPFLFTFTSCISESAWKIDATKTVDRNSSETLDTETSPLLEPYIPEQWPTSLASIKFQIAVKTSLTFQKLVSYHMMRFKYRRATKESNQTRIHLPETKPPPESTKSCFSRSLKMKAVSLPGCNFMPSSCSNEPFWNILAREVDLKKQFKFNHASPIGNSNSRSKLF